MAQQNERAVAYEKRQKELQKHCFMCKTRSPVRCESCTWGKKLRWLEAEYSDVTGCNHRPDNPNWKL